MKNASKIFLGIAFIVVIIVASAYVWLFVINATPKNGLMGFGTLVQTFASDNYPYQENPQTNFNTTTSSFFINDQMHIKWSCGGAHGDSSFDIKVIDFNSDTVVKEITSTPLIDGNSGEIYLNGAGKYYLKIAIIGELDNWEISVYNYK